LKKEAKNFYDLLPWALAAPAPMTRRKEVFLLLFLQKKKRFLQL
jgi:hypothetical protein